MNYKHILIPIMSVCLLIPQTAFASEIPVETAIENTEQTTEDDIMPISDLEEDNTDESLTVQGTSTVTITMEIADGTVPASDNILLTIYNINTSDLYTVTLTRTENYQKNISLPYGLYSLLVTPDLDYDTIGGESTFEVINGETNLSIPITGVTESEYGELNNNSGVVSAEKEQEEVVTPEEKESTRPWIVNNILTIVVIIALGVALWIAKQKRKQALEE